jgi:hypothetical protein
LESFADLHLEVSDRLAAGELLLEAEPPNLNRSPLGMLKSMYLAACLGMGRGSGH